MKLVTSLKSINARLFCEIGSPGLLAFIIVSAVMSITSPAPMSMTYFMNLV